MEGFGVEEQFVSTRLDEIFLSLNLIYVCILLDFNN